MNAPQSLDGLLWTLVIVGAVAFVVVEAVVAFVAFRSRRNSELSPRTIGFEAIWMLTPAVLLIGLVGWSARVLGGGVGDGSGEPAVVVHVTGKGFAWVVEYEVPDEKGGTRRVDAGFNRIHLPVGKPAKIVLASADRVHGFWVPQLRVKADAVPGIETPVLVTPKEEGELNIVCATLCGDQHYAMRGFIEVEPAEEFTAWLAKQ